MANLALQSFTTLGYFGAALLIAILAVLALTSFGSDSSGWQAVDTATPTPTPVGVGPGGDVSSISEGIEAAGAGGVVELHADVYDESVRFTQPVTIRPAGRGDVLIDRDCAEGPAIHVNSGSGVTVQGISIRNTSGSGVLGQKAAGNEAPGCPLTLD